MNPAIQRIMLRALARMGDEAMTEEALCDSVRIVQRPRPTDADIAAEIRHLEHAGLIAGVSDPLLGTTWKLTVNGRHTAHQLG